MDGIYQQYRVYSNPYFLDVWHTPTTNGFAVKIKQTKEDMRETNFIEKLEALCKRYNMSDGVRTDFISEVKEIIKDKEECNFKPFNLEEAKAGRPVCTRDGRKVRIICFDAKGDKPIIALVEMGVAETPNNYPIDGKAISTKETPCDLMMLPEKKEGWVNIYHDKEGNIYTDENVYNTEKDAINFCPHDKCRVATVKIEWEE